MKGYDYHQPGAYFITLCTQERAALFGEVMDGAVQPNDAGQMVHDVWEHLPAFFSALEIDAFVVMPNHLHALLVLLEPALPIGEVVQRFKMLTTKRYADGVKQQNWPAFPDRLWQRNYYEHIVRNDVALERLRRYVLENPERWASDEENPARKATARPL